MTEPEIRTEQGDTDVPVRRATTGGLVVASGALYFAAFPPLDLGFLAFVALVPLLLAIRSCSRRQAFLRGWMAGSIGICALVSSSIYGAAAQYFGGGSLALVGFSLLVPQVFGCVYFGLFAVLVHGWERRSPLTALLALPAAWTACELMRSNVGYGCPWVLLGHSQHERLLLVQIADVVGVLGVSFVVALVNVWIAAAVAQGVHAVRASTAIVVGVLAAVHGYGAMRIANGSEIQDSRELEVLLVQPNLPLRHRASITALSGNLRRLIDLTREQAGTADLVVWPENAVGFSVTANGSLLDAATSTLSANGHLLLGAPRETNGVAGSRFRNTAFLLDRRGSVLGSYDKLRLTPFAETSPWTIASFLTRRFAPSDVYEPGERLELFDIGTARFAVLICYEAIYADLSRNAVAAGAQFLVNISNDDWFGERAALQQHLIASMFRAVEARRFLLRVTNSGVSAVVDPIGRVVVSVPTQRAIAVAARILPSSARTLYLYWGDAFAWLCAAITVMWLLPQRTTGAPSPSAGGNPPAAP